MSIVDKKQESVTFSRFFKVFFLVNAAHYRSLSMTDGTGNLISSKQLLTPRKQIVSEHLSTYKHCRPKAWKTSFKGWGRGEFFLCGTGAMRYLQARWLCEYVGMNVKGSYHEFIL